MDDLRWDPRVVVSLSVEVVRGSEHVHGVVAHAQRGGAGMHFFGLAGPDRIAWNDYVRDRLVEARAA